MKNLRFACLPAILLLGISLASPVSAALENGALWQSFNSPDKINAHQGTIITVPAGRHGLAVKTYYWYGMALSNPYVGAGFNVYSSTDLVNWQFVANNPIPAALAPAGTQWSFERPRVLWNALTSRYVVWCHKANVNDISGGDKAFGYARAVVLRTAANTAPGGALSSASPAEFRPYGHQLRDFTLFEEGSTAHVFFASEKTAAAAGSAAEQDPNNRNAIMRRARLNADYTNVEFPNGADLSTIVVNGPVIYGVNSNDKWREAPVVWKNGSTYHMIASGATGWTPNAAEWFTASSVTGSWTRQVSGGNPINPFSGANAKNANVSQCSAIVGLGGNEYAVLADRHSGTWTTDISLGGYCLWHLTMSGGTTPVISGEDLNGVSATPRWSNPTPRTGGSYRLTNLRANQSMYVDQASTVNGGQMRVNGFTGAANERFSVYFNSAQGWSIFSNASKALRPQFISGSFGALSARIEQFDDDGTSEKRWDFEYVSGVSFRIKNRNSLKYMSVAGGSTAQFASIEQYSLLTGNDADIELFTVERLP
jgi:hypothetical protein